MGTNGNATPKRLSVVIATMLALAACGTDQAAPHQAHPTSTAAPAATVSPTGTFGDYRSLGTVDADDLPPFTAPTTAAGSSDGQPYSAALAGTRGATPDGLYTWELRYYTLAGTGAVATAFNQASQASAHTHVPADRHGDEATRSCAARVEPDRLVFRPTAIVEVLTGHCYCAGAAHWNNSVSTTVIDSRTARPITLQDLFTDEQAGLKRLSEQTVKLTTVVLPMYQSGVNPTEQNFGNWIPTDAGIVLFFQDFQIGGFGIRNVTVPWSAVADLIAPERRALIPA